MNWGYGKSDQLTTDGINPRKNIAESGPLAGYPACPDHTEKWTLWKLLDAERNTGIQLTENCAMWPGASVSGLYFCPPEARYFAVGKIERDQVLDYQSRKKPAAPGIERWLGPYLNYEPDQPQKRGTLLEK